MSIMSKIVGLKNEPLLSQNERVSKDYKRFNQKMNMIWRGNWDQEYEHLALADLYRKKILGNKPGLPQLENAFYFAATTNADACNFHINIANAGGTSWSPISRPGLDMPTFPKWECEPAKTTAIAKAMARTFGADDVGVCLLDRRWVYSHYYSIPDKESYPIRFSDEPGYECHTVPGLADDKSLVIPASMKYVLVFIYEMEEKSIATAPHVTHFAGTMHTYSKISFHTMAMAEFIRSLGYNAIPSSNCTAANIPLAIDAGLGEPSRMEKLVHPLYGPRCRIAKVFTDLPLVPDVPLTFGVEKFCGTCKKCAKVCPSKAIDSGEQTCKPKGSYSATGIRRWHTEHDKCRDYWQKMGTNCGICIQACPYNQPKGLSHWLVKSAIATMPFLNPLILKGSDLIGHGKLVSPEDFWAQF